MPILQNSTSFARWRYVKFVISPLPVDRLGTIGLLASVRLSVRPSFRLSFRQSVHSFVSGAYLLQFISYDYQIWCVNTSEGGEVSWTTFGVLWPWPSQLTLMLENTCPEHISYSSLARITKFSVWIHLGYAECCEPLLRFCDLDLWPLTLMLEKLCPEHISYSLSAGNTKFGVWIHLGCLKCHVTLLRVCDLDLDLWPWC